MVVYIFFSLTIFTALSRVSIWIRYRALDMFQILTPIQPYQSAIAIVSRWVQWRLKLSWRQEYSCVRDREQRSSWTTRLAIPHLPATQRVY